MNPHDKKLVVSAYDYLYENDKLNILYNTLDQIQKSHIYINTTNENFFYTNCIIHFGPRKNTIKTHHPRSTQL